MNRRGFIKGLVAVPFVGTALAKTSWAQRHSTPLTEVVTTTFKSRRGWTVYSGYEVLEISPEDLLSAQEYDWKTWHSKVSIQ